MAIPNKIFLSAVLLVAGSPAGRKAIRRVSKANMNSAFRKAISEESESQVPALAGSKLSAMRAATARATLDHSLLD